VKYRQLPLNDQTRERRKEKLILSRKKKEFSLSPFLLFDLGAAVVDLGGGLSLIERCATD
jgi:hypothetical protein